MYEGPSKFLYACGGWFLGGIAGIIVGGIIAGGAAAIFAAPGASLAGYLLLAEVIGFGGSVVGAIMGWNKAARSQEEYAIEIGRSVQSTRGPSISQEPALEYGKSFADKVSPKLREGSYAEAIASEKLNAAEAQAAR